MTNDRPLVIITGPTAAGKTELSVRLCEMISGEIISADSMQVYTGMDVGTAKVTKEEMRGIKHHMIDIFDPFHEFNVSEFKELSKKYAKDITDRGGIPVVCGGTGFYIQALLYDIDFKEEESDGYREKLREIAEKADGADILHNMLSEVDKESAAAIHKNNVKRVIRALEYHHNNNAKISTHNEESHNKEAYYNAVYFVLTMDRDKLYERIDRRVDIMVKEGLFEEMEGLIKLGLNRDNISMKGIGYRELFDYFDGIITREEAIEKIKLDTRHFAKRQLTWFKREKNVIWVDKDGFSNDNEILEYMLLELKNKGIIN